MLRLAPPLSSVAIALGQSTNQSDEECDHWRVNKVNVGVATQDLSRDPMGPSRICPGPKETTRQRFRKSHSWRDAVALEGECQSAPERSHRRWALGTRRSPACLRFNLRLSTAVDRSSNRPTRHGRPWAAAIQQGASRHVVPDLHRDRGTRE